ncbi:hypothetical protein AB0F45_32655, partial [Streptomyces achromogenes]|uniref:hypothetical protein n=1 Tax=Streptomyces achromogenes TaxID=67255 RepID=UPI0033F59AA2
IAGWSAYPRQLDFAEFRRIADETGTLVVGRVHRVREPGRRGGRYLPGEGGRRRAADVTADPRHRCHRAFLDSTAAPSGPVNPLP